MALSTDDITILEEVIAKAGNCLDSKRCTRCPFRSMCLPEFLNVVPPTQGQRMQLAMNVLTHHGLIDSEVSADEVEQEYTWDKE